MKVIRTATAGDFVEITAMFDKPRTLRLDGKAMRYLDGVGINLRKIMIPKSLKDTVHILYACTLHSQGREGKLSFDVAADSIFSIREAIGVVSELLGNKLSEGAPYVPSDKEVIAKAISLAKEEAGKSGTFYDLGCGDGRVLLTAHVSGFRNLIGYEKDPGRIRIATRVLEKNADGSSFEIVPKNFLEMETHTILAGSVIYMYLWYELMPKLSEMFSKLPGGVVLVCVDFPLVGWEAIKVESVDRHTIYVYKTRDDGKHIERTVDMDNLSEEDINALADLVKEVI